MTEESKPKKTETQVKNLELNRETLQDLTMEQAERVAGGVAAGERTNAAGIGSENCSNNPCTGWGGPVGDTRRCVC